jgi:hypothetical protein
MVKTLLVTGVLIVTGVTVAGEGSASEPVARELTAAMEKRMMDSIAAADPADPGRLVAALLLPGQLLVVSGRHSADAFMTDRLARKQYRDIYTTLSSSSIPETRFFVQDLGADGVHSTGESVDVVYVKVVEQLIFDGHPEKRKMNKRIYDEKFEQVDERYSQFLKLLLDAARAAS